MKQSIKINPTSKRGGQRNPKPKKLSTSRVLDYLFKQYGGTFKLAEDLGVYSQMVSKWIAQGYVPMKWVGPVSRLIQRDRYLLNYEGMILLEGNNVSWQFALQAGWTELDGIKPRKYFLAGTPPRTPKEILG